MSIRTLIEINHDCLHKIEKDPESFGKALIKVLEMGGINSSVSNYQDEAHAELRRRGAAVKHQRHHSSPCPTGNDSF